MTAYTNMPRACITCGKLVYGRSRCAAHTSKSSSGWARYAQLHPLQAACYSSGAWRERRARQLAEHPDCAVCGQPARHADHILNVAAGGSLSGPLQSLCAAHHKAKTQAESKQGNRAAAARRRQGR